MGQSANIFDVTGLRAALPMRPVPRTGSALPPNARLIPGAAHLNAVGGKKNSQSVLRQGSWAANQQVLPLLPARLAQRLLPESLRRFHPSWLGVALMDAAMIAVVFFYATAFYPTAIFEPIGLRIDRPLGLVPPLHQATFLLFIVAFFFFATQEGLYSNCCRSLREEYAVVAKAVVWTTLFAGLSLLFSSWRTLWFPLLLRSSASGAALCAARALFATVFGPRDDGELHNVLIIGSRAVAPHILTSVEHDSRCGSSVKGLVEEQHLCGPDGPDTLRTIAREECIDEVIIATSSPEIAQAAIRESRRNHLDVRIVPPFFGSLHSPEMETSAGIPLIKVHEEAMPCWGLAVKRLMDVLLAGTGLLLISPLLLLIAGAVTLDSSGPILYRAVRVGRKKRWFTCYKFRTMIPEADAGREALRSRNERDGAFFKIANDPRATRVGRFLRRYSLDELPQLWNVLRGEMSLVGPRPHPPDDVDRYRVEHMQRLDFLPGITGLWQVTARGDSSFEASVRLDVEYIQTWSLGLDLRILCQTIPAVFDGSGA